jgi:hypothetical protein
VSSFALTLDQVRADLKKNSISGDSIELSVRTSVSTVGSKQSVSVFFVQKGKNKIYSEINTSFLNQRSIVNGSRMKIIDLNTNKFWSETTEAICLPVDRHTAFAMTSC